MSDASLIQSIILQRNIAHQYELDKLTTSQLQDLNKVLAKSKKELEKMVMKSDLTAWQKDRAAKQMAEVDALTLATKKQCSMYIDQTVAEAAAMSYDAHSKILSFDGMVQPFNDVSLSAAQVRAFVQDAQVGGATLSKWVDKTFSNTMKAGIKEEIGAGMLAGESMREIANRMKTGFDMTARELTTLTRTYVQGINSKAALDVYSANKDIVKGIRWSAHMELGKAGGGTCLACAALDGNEYSFGSHPACPLHPRCRCALIPVTKTWRELGLNLDEISKVYRPYILGPKSAPGFTQGNYSDWFIGLSNELKLKTLGPARHELYITGQNTFQSFVDQFTGRKLTLAEIKPGWERTQILPEVPDLAKMQQQAMKLQQAEEITALLAKYTNPEEICTFTKDMVLPKPMIPESSMPKLNEDKPIYDPLLPNKPLDKKQSFGVIMVDDSGNKVWMIEPNGHYGGYENTFPKGTFSADADLTWQSTALKECWEETGLSAEIVGYLGDYEKSESITRYYIGKMIGGNPTAFDSEVQAVKLVPINKAAPLLNKQIDKVVLEDLDAKITEAHKLGLGDWKDGIKKINETDLEKVFDDYAKTGEATKGGVKQSDGSIKEYLSKAEMKGRAEALVKAITDDIAQSVVSAVGYNGSVWKSVDKQVYIQIGKDQALLNKIKALNIKLADIVDPLVDKSIEDAVAQAKLDAAHAKIAEEAAAAKALEEAAAKKLASEAPGFVSADSLFQAYKNAKAIGAPLLGTTPLSAATDYVVTADKWNANAFTFDWSSTGKKSGQLMSKEAWKKKEMNETIDRMAKNFEKGGIAEQSAEGRLAVQNAINNNYSNELYAKVVAATPGENVVYCDMWDAAADAGSNGKSMGGTTFIWTKTPKALSWPLEAAKGDMDAFNWGGTGAEIRHEFGHNIYKELLSDSSKKEWGTFWKVNKDVIKDVITSYSTASSEEAFCDMFALVTQNGVDYKTFPNLTQDARTIMAKILKNDMGIDDAWVNATGATAKSAKVGELQAVANDIANNHISWLDNIPTSEDTAAITDHVFNKTISKLTEDSSLLIGLSDSGITNSDIATIAKKAAEDAIAKTQLAAKTPTALHDAVMAATKESGGYVGLADLNAAEKQHINKLKAKVMKGLVPKPGTEVANTWNKLNAAGQEKVLGDLVKKGHSIPDALPIKDEVVKPFAKVVEVKSIEDVKGPLNFNDFVKYDAQGGSNEGGYYHHKNNPAERYYIKFPASADAAHNEILAGALYKEAGVEMPALRACTDGDRTGIASTIIDGVKKDPAKLIEGIVRTGVGDNFAVDAWLADWDAVGTGYDNLLVKDGIRAVRIDVGGSLRYRAQGGLKSASQWGPEVGELDSMRMLAPDGSNQYAVNVFKNMTEEELERGVQKVISMSDAKISQLVQEYSGLQGAEMNKLSQTLIARKNYIAEKFPNVKPIGVVTKAPMVEGKVITSTEISLIKDARINGYSVRIDKGDIEDQKVLFWQQKDVGGADQICATFKLHGERKSAVSAQISVTSSGKAAAESMSTRTLDDQIKEAVIGIAKQHNIGQVLREVDIDRAKKAILTWDKTIQSLDVAKDLGKIGQAEYDKIVGHYARWINELQTVKIRSVGEAYKWSPIGDPIFKGMGEITLKAPAIKASAKESIIWTKNVGTFPEKNIINGHAQLTGNDIMLKQLNSTKYNFVYEADIDGVKARYWEVGSMDYEGGGINFANDGRLEFITQGSPEEQASKILDAMSRLGINSERATAADIEELYLRQIFYVRKERDYEAIMAGASNIIDPAKRVEYLQTTLSNKLSITRDELVGLQNYNPVGEYQAFGHGNAFSKRPDLYGKEWDAFEEKYILTHQLYQEPLEAFERILNNGGQMAPSTDKLRRGFSWGGMSPVSDMSSGGASFAFARIATKTQAANEVGIFWTPKALKRMDAISYQNDKYGRCTRQTVWNERKSTVDAFKDCAKNWTMGDGNETVFKNSLSIFDDLDHIGVYDNQLDSMIALFKKHLGSDRFPDGRLITDVIVRVGG